MAQGSTVGVATFGVARLRTATLTLFWLVAALWAVMVAIASGFEAIVCIFALPVTIGAMEMTTVYSGMLLARRPLLFVDARGIFDRRFMPEPVAWSEILYIDAGLDWRCAYVGLREMNAAYVSIAAPAWRERTAAMRLFAPLDRFRCWVGDDSLIIDLAGLDASLHELVETFYRFAPQGVRTRMPVLNRAAPVPSGWERFWASARALFYVALLLVALAMAAIFYFGEKIAPSEDPSFSMQTLAALALGNLLIALLAVLLLRLAVRRARGMCD